MCTQKSYTIGDWCIFSVLVGWEVGGGGGGGSFPCCQMTLLWDLLVGWFVHVCVYIVLPVFHGFLMCDYKCCGVPLFHCSVHMAHLLLHIAVNIAFILTSSIIKTCWTYQCLSHWRYCDTSHPICQHQSPSSQSELLWGGFIFFINFF